MLTSLSSCEAIRENNARTENSARTELVPGNVLAVDKVLYTNLVVQLQNSSVRTISNRQFYAYLIDAQDSQFTQQYLNLLDAHLLSQRQTYQLLRK